MKRHDGCDRFPATNTTTKQPLKVQVKIRFSLDLSKTQFDVGLTFESKIRVNFMDFQQDFETVSKKDKDWRCSQRGKHVKYGHKCIHVGGEETTQVARLVFLQVIGTNYEAWILIQDTNADKVHHNMDTARMRTSWKQDTLRLGYVRLRSTCI